MDKEHGHVWFEEVATGAGTYYGESTELTYKTCWLCPAVSLRLVAAGTVFMEHHFMGGVDLVREVKEAMR